MERLHVDGQRLLIGSSGLALWDAATQQRLYKYPGHAVGCPCHLLAFSCEHPPWSLLALLCTEHPASLLPAVPQMASKVAEVVADSCGCPSFQP